jgi:hypothetical protein
MTGINDTKEKYYRRCRCHWRQLFTGVVDTSEKIISGVMVTGDKILFSGVVDTGNKFIASAVVTGDNCSPVLLIPAKNLSSVSLSPAIIFQRC